MLNTDVTCQNVGEKKNVNFPLVSIVIPTYNRKFLLQESFLSVVSQTYRPVEIILVNDGSTDGTESIKKRLLFTAWANGIHTVWLDQENKGVSSARNYGMKHCKGKYLLFHDSDDVIDRKRVELQVAMLEFLQADVCAASKKTFDNNWNILSVYSPRLKSRVLLSDMEVKKMHWGTPMFMYKRSVLKGIWWDENISRGEDTEFNFRVFQKKLKVCYEPMAVTYAREHNEARLTKSENFIDTYKLIHTRMLDYYKNNGRMDMFALDQNKVLHTIYNLYVSGNKKAAYDLFQTINPISKQASESILEKFAFYLDSCLFFCLARKLNTNLGKIIDRLIK